MYIYIYGCIYLIINLRTAPLHHPKPQRLFIVHDICIYRYIDIDV